MTDQRTYLLEAVKDGQVLNVCFCESRTSLRPNIDFEVDLNKIHQLSEEIISLIHRLSFSAALSSQIQDDLRKLCLCLFDELLPEQIRSHIKRIPGGEIIISIDESLVFIPWELLFDGNEYLSLKFSLGRIVRTSRRVRESTARCVGVPPKMLVLADPCGDLAGAQKEARVLRNQLDRNGGVIVNTRTGNITLEYVKKNIRDYDILHYAGHADCGGSNEYSGLRLSDGMFSVEDIHKLGVTAPLPALIFCNACQSARDDAKEISRGVFGIANAFLVSGVRHYIGCLWKIPDHESVTAAEIFYQHIFANQTIGESLRLARLELAKIYGSASLVWAAYVLYGDPSVGLGVTSQSPALLAKRTGSRMLVLGISALLAVAILAAGFRVSFYFQSKPQVPTIIIEDFTDQVTEKTDESFTYRVINELKKISAVTLLGPQQPSGLQIRKAKNQRKVDSTIKRLEDGRVLVMLKVSDPVAGRIVAVDELTVSANQVGAGEIAMRIVDLVKASLSREDQIEITRHPKDNPQAHRLLSQAWDLFSAGDFAAALELCLKVKEIDPENLVLYRRMGNIYDRMGKRDLALDAYYKYAELCKKTNDLKNLSNAYFNIGWIIELMGDDELGYKYYERGLQIAQLGQYSYEIAKGYSLQGAWHCKHLDFIKARSLTEQSIVINQSNLTDDNHRYYLAANYNQLGLVYEKEEDYSSSLKYLNLSLNLFKEIGAGKVIEEVRERIERIFDKQKESEKF